MVNRNVMAAHQLFIFSRSASLLLLYLPLKIHFEASLLELVITHGPPPHQFQDRSHRERLSSFASFLSSSMRCNDKHLLSGAFLPSSLAVPTPPAVPILYICHCCPPYQTGACMQFSRLSCTCMETAPLPGHTFFPHCSESLPSTAGGIIVPDKRVHLLPGRC